MINSRIYIKSLTSAEAGETNMNDTYIRIPNTFNAPEFFGLEDNSKLHFEAIDPESNKKYSLRFEVTTKNNEQRIYKLGVFCREKGLHAGDTISLEHLTIDGESSYIIRYRRLDQIVLLHKFRKGYLFERNDIGDSIINEPLKLQYNGIEILLNFTFIERAHKRSDSPDEYEVYEVTLNNGQKLSDINSENYIIIDLDNKTIVPFETTKGYRISQE